MKKSILLITGLFLFTTTSFGQTLYDAGKMDGGLGSKAHITKTYPSDDGAYYYITGWFTDSLDVDPGTGVQTLYATPGNKAGFVAKYTTTGSVNTAMVFNSNADSVIIYDIYDDYISGEFIVAGVFNGTMTVPGSGGTLTAANQYSGFISRFDAGADNIFSAQMDGASGNSCVTSISRMGGLTLIGGWFNGSITFDGTTFVNALAQNDAFVASYDALGNYLNKHQFLNGTGDEKVVSAIYDDGYIYITGTFNNLINFDFTGVTAPFNAVAGTSDVFLGKYDGGYNIIWGLPIGGSGTDKPVAFRDGTLVMDFQANFNANPSGAAYTLTSAGGTDIAIINFDGSGNLLWAKRIGNADHNRASFFTYKSVDQYYIGTSFSTTLDMDPGPAVVEDNTTGPSVNGVVIELSRLDGSFKQHYRVEGTSVKGFLVEDADVQNVMMVGEFSGSNRDILPFDSTALVSTTSTQGLYMTRFNRCKGALDISLAAPFACYSCDASLLATPTGLVAPVDFNWSTYHSGPETVITGVCPGDDIYATYYDYYGCFGYSNYLDIIDHDGVDLEGTISVTNSSCGNNYGSASVVVTGNIGPYTYDWSNGSNTSVADSLASGFYTLYITDSTGCYVTETFAINNTDGPAITVTSTGNPSCGGDNTGTIDITVTGGAAPLTYVWSNGATTQDLSGVPAGTYAVIVTDAAGCTAQTCVTLSAPDAMYVMQLYGNNSTCLLNTGSAAVMTSGGVEPYSYQWSVSAGSQTNDTVTALFAGLHRVTVTDANGCQVTETIGISDAGGPFISLLDFQYVSCSFYLGYIEISSGATSFQWSNGQTTQNIYNLSEGGKYVVAATAPSGCISTTEYYIGQYGPSTPELCMVTVDSTNTKNVVIWDKTATPEAVSYNIYREGFCSSSEFLPVGNVLHTDYSIFEDTVVNTATRSWQYYITAVDSCGVESDPSTVNRTIHLTSVYDNDISAIVLDWEQYIGKTVTQYNIFRIDPVDPSIFTQIDSVGGLTLNYNDDDNFSAYTTHDIEYYIEAVPSDPCYASRAFNQNASRSNHTRVSAYAIPDDTTGMSLLPAIENIIKVYPNPANDRLNISVSNQDVSYQAVLMNHVGQTIKNFEVNRTTSVSTRELQQGVYFLRLVGTDKQSKTYKIIVAH